MSFAAHTPPPPFPLPPPVSLGRGEEARLDVGPVDDVPDGREVVGAHVLVLQVCGREKNGVIEGGGG